MQNLESYYFGSYYDEENKTKQSEKNKEILKTNKIKKEQKKSNKG